VGASLRHDPGSPAAAAHALPGSGRVRGGDDGGEGKNTWRTGRYSPCPRQHAGQYLTFLAAAGYQLSSIEQAVADGTPWTGGTEPAGSLPADPAPAGDPASAAGEPGLSSEHTGGAADPEAPDTDTGGAAIDADQAAA
jgi:hypothetical protein